MSRKLRKLLRDPEAARIAIAKFKELRECVTELQKQVGPEFRKFVDTHDISFSTMNALVKFGEKLSKGVAIVKETVTELGELAEEDMSEPNQQG